MLRLLGWVFLTALEPVFLITRAHCRRDDRRYIGAEAAIQSAIMDAHISRVEKLHGSAGVRRIAELAQLEIRGRLTAEQWAELEYLRNSEVETRQAAE